MGSGVGAGQSPSNGGWAMDIESTSNSLAGTLQSISSFDIVIYTTKSRPKGYRKKPEKKKGKSNKSAINKARHRTEMEQHERAWSAK